MQRENGERGVTVLMPVHLRQLNEERSVLTADGRFTVIGKVMRLFRPWAGDDRPAAHAGRVEYVDTEARELWRQPLIDAPAGLICRADPACETRIEEAGAHGVRRRRLTARVHGHIGDMRQHLLANLKRETQILRAGAIVIPIAIYQ